MQTTRTNLRVASSAESELERALRVLSMDNEENAEDVDALLLGACQSARHSLSGIAPGDRPLPWAKFARTLRVDEQLEACFQHAQAAITMARGPGDDLTRTAIALFRDISAIYACEVAEPDVADADEKRQYEPAYRIARALWRLACAAKWTFFMRVQSDATFWRQCHALQTRVEALGLSHESMILYRQSDLDAFNCSDLYAHILLLDMLNNGNLSPPQIDLAQRWLIRNVRNCTLHATQDAASHPFHVDTQSEAGLEAGAPGEESPSAVRYLDIVPVHDKLLRSREALRRGTLDLEGGELNVSVLDYGTFLDVAERVWSPDFIRLQQRASRTRTSPQRHNVTSGFDQLVWAISAGSAMEAVPCLLRDRSDTGAGLLADGEGRIPDVGALVGFCAESSALWEIGTVARRLVEAEASGSLLGIRIFTDHPVIVMLRVWKPGTATLPDGAEHAAIFVARDNLRNRADSLILDEPTYRTGKNFTILAGDTTYHIRLNRVLERGSGWVRAGYQVLSKKK